MAGRPKMTEAQKAAAKAEREKQKAAATAGAGAKADRAEARSTNGKPPTAAAAASNPASSQNTDDLDREEKALFLHHMPLIKAAKEALNSANSNLRNMYKKAKAEGNFTKADFDTAFALETAEKEARERAKIARQLKIAKIVGSSLGGQLDLFLEPDRTPAADIAFEEGERDAMQNLAAKPKYDPSTEQYRKYMEGFHGVSAKRVREGIGQLDPEAGALAEKEAAGKVEADVQRGKDAAEFDKPPAGNDKPPAESVKETASAPPAAQPQSGTPMTRAQFKAQQEAQKAAAAAGKPN